MADVKVECTNPEEMKLRVTTEMTIAEWKYLVDRVSGVPYYRQLDEFVSGIRRAIFAFEGRAVATFETKDGPA